MLPTTDFFKSKNTNRERMEGLLDGSVQHAIHDLKVVSSSPTLGLELTLSERGREKLDKQ